MAVASGTVHDATALRVGFLDRTFALGIDLLIINLVVAVVGLALVGPSGGKLRVSSAVVNVITCTKGEIASSGIAIPAGFTVGDVHFCTRSTFGIAHDWQLVVVEKVAAGDDPKQRRLIEVPVDRQQRPTQPFYVDNLILVLLAAYLFLLEWRCGTTLGKRVLRVYVQSIHGTPTPDMLQAAKRTLPRVIGLVGLILVDGIDVSSIENGKISARLVTAASVPDFGVWFDVFRLLAIAYLLSAIIAIALRHLPLHDRWAGTEAVRPGIVPRG